jgi:Aspartyl protease
MNRRLGYVVCLMGMLWYPQRGWTQSDLPSTREQHPASSSNVMEQRKLQFQLHRGYLVIVKGLVDRNLEVNFLVDTGAFPSVIDRGVAASLRLEKRPAHVNLTRKTIETNTAVLPSLVVGPIHVSSLTVLAQDLSFLSKAIDYKLGGIVGLDVLRNLSFTIDYKTKEMEFGAIRDLTSCAPFETDTPLVSIRMASHNRRFRVVIDTGGPDLMFLKSRVSEAARFEEIGSEQVRDSGESFERRKVLVPDMYLGGETFGSQIAFVVDDRVEEGDNFDAVLGVRGAHLRKIGFDFEHRKFCWDR